MKLFRKSIVFYGIFVVITISAIIPSIKANPPSTFTNDNPDGSPRRPILNMYLSDPHGAFFLTISADTENWSQYSDYDVCTIGYEGTIFSPENLLYFEIYFDSLRNYYGTYLFSLDNIEINFWQWLGINGESGIFALTIFNFFTGTHEFLYADEYIVPDYEPFIGLGMWHYYTGNKTNLADPILDHYLDDYGRVKITALYYVKSSLHWIFFWPIWSSAFKVEIDEVTVKTTWIPRTV